MKRLFYVLCTITLVFIIVINTPIFAEDPGPCSWEILHDYRLTPERCGPLNSFIKYECQPGWEYWYCCTEWEMECVEPPPQP